VNGSILPAMFRNRASGLMLVFLMGFMLWTSAVFYPRYKQPGANAAIAWDAAGYYWYLPSVFIYHDLTQQHWADSVIRTYQPGPEDMTGLGFKVDNGNWVLKYPAGMAVVEAPFFLAAHAVAKPMGYPRDGFSRPYQAAIQFGALLMAFVGLIGLRRLMLFYYPDVVVAAVLAVLVIGTNYLNYSSIDGSIAHSWLFSLYVFLMLASRRFYERPSISLGAAVGALCGLAALIRPTDAVAVLIPVLWGLELRKDAIIERFQFWWNERWALILAVLCGIALLSVQLFYWKYTSGHWLVYSYQDQGFSWLHPHVLDYTLSYRSGWLWYTPVMWLAVIGFVPFLRKGQNRLAIALFSGVAFYLVTAWDIWWYAGMGGRAMVQYYAALMFPLAALFELAFRRKWLLWLVVPMAILFCYVNIWFTWHAHGGSLYDSEDGMSKEYYWRVIGRWSASPEVAKLKDGRYLYAGQLPENRQLIFADSLEGGELVLGSSREFSQSYLFAIRTDNGGHWLRASAAFFTPQLEHTAWQMMQMSVTLKRDGKPARETMIRVQRFIPEGRWERQWVDLKLPELRAGDSGEVHFWNPGSKTELRMRDLRVEEW
jgi:hypothetical protein